MVRAAEANISQGVSLLQILRRAEQHGRGDNSVRAKTGPAAKIGCPPVRPATQRGGHAARCREPWSGGAAERDLFTLCPEQDAHAFLTVAHADWAILTEPSASTGTQRAVRGRSQASTKS